PADAAAAEEPRPAAGSVPRPKHDFLERLPSSVRGRVLALKQLQKRCDKIEARFDQEFQALEKKYNDIYKPLLAKIQELTGEMEGCAWASEGADGVGDNEDEDEDGDDDEDDSEDGDQGAAAGASGAPAPGDPRK
ncbi:PREDICTED: nucleosome assembly protein 1-like 5, partial [Chinchilla lanigera]|uniref:nucleosome assembly protein 1-like 5 n=1 Tax=Chinchilla lanigera TaxID=34839 RepID=UPI00038EAF2B